MSLKSAYDMYRVDGVSGLNVFTGINQTRFPKSATWRAKPSILLPRESVIGSAGYAVRAPAEQRNGQYSKVDRERKGYLKKSELVGRRTKRERILQRKGADTGPSKG